MLIKPMLPVVEYVVNYEYISKVLCENKSKPKMNCNGKCHLMKEMAKASENEKPISDKKIVTQEFEILFFEEIQSFQINTYFLNIESTLNAKYNNQYFHLSNDLIFHPPIFI
jgi:hypothetical protein